LTPGAQKFLGIGDQILKVDGIIDSASPQTLVTVEDFFDSTMIGKTVWILPQDTSIGNEGPRRIAAITDAKTVTLAGTVFATDETDVWFVLKTYQESGYLTDLQREDREVIDGSRGYSTIDQLRRSIFVDFAEGEELDVIGGNLGVARTRIMSDEIYRRFIKVRAYLPATTIHALEMVLQAIFPQGGWIIYEDLVNRPNEVFLELPTMALGSDFEGRGFLAPSGVFPISTATISSRGYELVTSATSTTLTVSHTPITVSKVELQDVVQNLGMGVLPSADTPAWTYINEGDTEGNVFSVAAGKLSQTQSGAPTVNGGRYEITVAQFDDTYGAEVEVTAWWRADTLTAVNGYPWHLGIEHDAIDRQVFLMWSDTQVILGQSDETVQDGPVTPVADIDDGNWHHFRLKVMVREEGNFAVAHLDGENLFGEVNLSGYNTTTVKEFSFGYVNNANSQDWTVEWDNVRTVSKTPRNYWNIGRDDGSLALASAILTSAAGLFVSGDTGKVVRTYGMADNRNYGLWAATYTSATQLTLSAIQRTGATVSGQTTGSTVATVTLDNPLFLPEDVGKSVTISGSGLGNDGTYTVLSWVNARQITVNNAGGFTDETGLTWEMDVAFQNESNMRWELVDTGTFVTTALTLRDALPLANTPARVHYTAVLSAQTLTNEFVRNEGSGGAEPNIFYPLYLFDVDLETRAIFDDVTAAGVIPRYKRDF
jgi:hypothetical protein